MTQKLDPVAARQATKAATLMAAQRAGRTAAVGVLAAIVIVVFVILA